MNLFTLKIHLFYFLSHEMYFVRTILTKTNSSDLTIVISPRLKLVQEGPNNTLYQGLNFLPRALATSQIAYFVRFLWYFIKKMVLQVEI